MIWHLARTNSQEYVFGSSKDEFFRLNDWITNHECESRIVNFIKIHDSRFRNLTRLFGTSTFWPSRITHIFVINCQDSWFVICDPWCPVVSYSQLIIIYHRRWHFKILTRIVTATRHKSCIKNINTIHDSWFVIHDFALRAYRVQTSRESWVVSSLKVTSLVISPWLTTHD